MKVSRLLGSRNSLTGLPCCENNSNNGFIYNSTNGSYDNNNKNNSNSCCPFLEYGYDVARLLSYPYNYIEILRSYRLSRAGKRGKNRRMLFDFMYIFELARITHEVNNCEYIPRTCERFVVDETKKPREIISSSVADCVVHQLWGNEVTPYTQAAIPENSYSCQEGKGGLKMMQDMYDLIYNVSLGYTRKCWLFIFDLQRCFMSIDRKLANEDLDELVINNFPAGDRRNILLYLNRVIFQASPDEGCRTICHPHRMALIPEGKLMKNAPRGFGLALGKWPSQIYINYSTRRHLAYMKSLHIPCCLYTDDTMGIVLDDNAPNPEGYCTKSQLLMMLPSIARNFEESMHLHLHPDKFYFQPLERGMRCLSYRFIGGNILPNKTITGNLLRKVDYYCETADKSKRYMLRNAEHFMSVINSYMGILLWANTKTMRKKIMRRIAHSAWAKIFDIYPTKILPKSPS